MTTRNIAIIGAGPYGLSVAAHLNAAGMKTRVYGECMSFWDRHMPVGMLLRSPWVASNLSDAKGELTLDTYKSQNGNHFSAPVPLDRFIDYGRWFQRRAVPDIDPRQAVCIDAVGNGFTLKLTDGEVVAADRVIVASGILPFASQPTAFQGLSPDVVSHSSENKNRDLRRFGGQRLVVLGGGQSALESAALLHEVGADVEVIVRNPSIVWLHKKPILHTWPFSSLLYAWPDVGPAVLSHVVARPNSFRSLPRGLQDKWGVRAIRPAGAQWLKPRVDKILPLTTGRSIMSAAQSGGEVRLTLDDGSERRVNHVLLATGYRVNIALYQFLAENLLKAIHCVNGYPVLNAGFESSVPGLYFLGAPAAWSFGPLMRFVAGADFAARSLVRKILEDRGESQVN